MKKGFKYPVGSYCDIKSHVVIIPGPSQEEIEKLARKYNSSPRKNWTKVRLHN